MGFWTLEGKRVAVIGGASGIGFAIAAMARDLGADVVIGTRQQHSLDKALHALPGATGALVDVTDEAAVAAFFAALPALDHLAVTAGDWGGLQPRPATEIDLTAARAALNVRFWGTLAVAKHAAGTIVPGGSITLTSGMLVRRPQKGMPLASAIGSAMEGLVAGLAVDIAPIRVNAVCPGLVLTEVVQAMPAAYREAAVSRQPVPRTATPEEAASAYIYAMRNAYVTGQVLPVDGGGSVV
jgi:NAD(P)-dependent dehydrogenase (short-subunit alcohol dehydrogenase family)